MCYEFLETVINYSKQYFFFFKTLVHELNIRIEEVNRTVTEVTSQRQRLSQENAELLKEIHEYKVSLDNVNHLKSQLAIQLEDTRRRLEDEERVI